MEQSRFMWKSLFGIIVVFAVLMIVPMFSLAPTWYRPRVIPEDVLSSIELNNTLRSEQLVQTEQAQTQTFLDIEILPIDTNSPRIPVSMILIGIILILISSAIYIWRVYDRVKILRKYIKRKRHPL